MKIVNFLLVMSTFSTSHLPLPTDGLGSAGYSSSVSSPSSVSAREHEYDTGVNITNIIERNNVGLNVTETPAVSCEVAKIKCALRQGCGSALQSYMLDCADILEGRIAHCDEFCEASLIALTSTEEGESLMSCHCSDDFCAKAKSRLDVCKNKVVLANAHNAVVSCGVAHLICAADTSCSAALFYYDKFCRRMFNGRGCSFRCNNSISILGRQEKASKLSTCVCDGTEPFACARIKTNMATLCFNQGASDEERAQKEEEETNRVDGKRGTKNETSSKGGSAAAGCSSGSGCGGLFVWLVMVGGVWSSGGGGWLVGGMVWLRYLVGLTSSVVVRWG